MLTESRRNLIAVCIIAVLLMAVVFLISLHPRVARQWKGEIVVSIAGDVLLDRGVGLAMEEHGDSYPHLGVSELFLEDDITIANLECPLTESDAGAVKHKKFVFKASPSQADTLKAAGFDVFTLANNHTMDYLSAGLLDTMDALEGAGLEHAGAGENAQSIKPLFIERNGRTIGLLSYSSLPIEGYVHDDSKATIAYARAGSLDAMEEEIAQAAAACDFLFVYFHWGTEYRYDVSDMQKEVAHAAADAGASAVIGTHPHVLQGREMYNGVPIYYSIGNFIFDKQLPQGTDHSLILQFTIGRDGGYTIEEIPVLIKDCQPVIATGEQGEAILESLVFYSRRFD